MEWSFQWAGGGQNIFSHDGAKNGKRSSGVHTQSYKARVRSLEKIIDQLEWRNSARGFVQMWSVKNLTNFEHQVFHPQMVKINEGLVAADLLRLLWLAKKKQWWLNVLMVGLLWGHPQPSCLCFFLSSLFPGWVERGNNNWTATVLALHKLCISIFVLDMFKHV